jgi:flagellar FliL protein
MSDTTPAAGKKSKKGLFMTVIALVLLGGGGAGAYFFYLKPAPKHAVAEAEPEPEPEHATGIVKMEPFVVNLADTGASRFLRCNLSLVVADEALAKEIEEKPVELARVRSAILELLALQQADQLVTPEGKEALKQQIVERAAHAVHELKVADVLFSEFVIQF